MATLSLNTNLSSLQTQRRLAGTTSSLCHSYQRLSSGLRVSRASDDAAGMAVASMLDLDARVFSQGLRNLSDGVSITNIAEGALNELTNAVTRLQELAQQSANGTLATKQRAALDAEAQALSKEYFRIVKTADFNCQKLFDGALQNLSLQAGYGTGGALGTSLDGKLGTGSFGTNLDLGTAVRTDSISLGDINGDGIFDIVSASSYDSKTSVFLGNGDGTFKARADLTMASGARVASLRDLNSDGTLDIVSANQTAGTASVLLGNGDGTFKAKMDFTTGAGPVFISIGDLNGDDIVDIVSANNSANTASVLLGNGNGTFKAKVDFTTGSSVRSVSLGDLNGDGALDIVSANSSGVGASVLIANGDGSFKAKQDFVTDPSTVSISLGDLNGDGALDIVSGNYWQYTVSVLLGNGNGTFRSDVDLSTRYYSNFVTLDDLNGDGALDIVSADTPLGASVFLGNGNGTFKAAAFYTTGFAITTLALGDLNRDGVLDIASANRNGNSVSVLLGETRNGVSPLLSFSLKTKADAKWAIELMEQKLTQLAQQRGVIGAAQSRLATAVANLQVESENYNAASSRITDADVASESSHVLKAQILQQAASAVLSQANQAPALALKLLNG